MTTHKTNPECRIAQAVAGAIVATAVAGCAAPLSKRDIVSVPAGGQEHQSLSRACRPVGDVSAYTMMGNPRGDNSYGRHQAMQSMLAKAPEETTHIAYSSVYTFGTLAQGEAFDCPEGFRLGG